MEHFDVELHAMGTMVRNLIQGAMDDIMGEQRCGYTWELLDPNDEDRALARTHVCRLFEGQHRTHHVCACGDTHACE